MKKLTVVGLAMAISVWALPVMAGGHDSSDPNITIPIAYESPQAFSSFANLLANADFAGVKNANEIELKQVNVLKYSDVLIGNTKATANGGYSKVDSDIETSPASDFDRKYSKKSSGASVDADVDAKVKIGPAKAIAKTAINVGDSMTTSTVTGIYGVTLSGASVNVNQAALNTVTAVANTTFNQGRR